MLARATSIIAESAISQWPQRPLPHFYWRVWVTGDLSQFIEMDFQHRAGGKTGGGGVAGWSESNRDRKERLRKLALETIDLAKVQWMGTI